MEHGLLIIRGFLISAQTIVIMKEKDLMKLITSEYSWEQVIYQVIAWEGLDPWDLDLKALSKTFLQYLVKLEELDFKVPAKYIIIAAVLLRMKSDNLELIDIVEGGEQQEMEEFGEIESLDEEMERPNVGPLEVPPHRLAKRRIMVSELVSALRKALNTHERRHEVKERIRKRVVISQEDVTKRIESLYMRINDILKEMKESEVKFSKLVNKWEREEIVNTFLPLIFLDNAKKVRCRQDEMFEEIFIRRRESNKIGGGVGSGKV